MVVCHSSEPSSGPARSLVIAAGGGRDLAWPQQRVAAELLARSGGRLVHLLLYGGARGADAAIGRAAQQLGWSALVMPAQWERHGRAAGPIRNRELLEQAIARAVALSSPGCLTSVLVVAFPGGAGTASLVRSPPHGVAFPGADCRGRGQSRGRALGRAGWCCSGLKSFAPSALRSLHSSFIPVSPSWQFSPPIPALAVDAPAQTAEASGPTCSLQRASPIAALNESDRSSAAIAQLARAKASKSPR